MEPKKAITASTPSQRRPSWHHGLKAVCLVLAVAALAGNPSTAANAQAPTRAQAETILAARLVSTADPYGTLALAASLAGNPAAKAAPTAATEAPTGAQVFEMCSRYLRDMLLNRR